jgi:hypothetical protein
MMMIIRPLATGVRLTQIEAKSYANCNSHCFFFQALLHEAVILACYYHYHCYYDHHKNS